MRGPNPNRTGPAERGGGRRWAGACAPIGPFAFFLIGLTLCGRRTSPALGPSLEGGGRIRRMGVLG